MEISKIVEDLENFYEVWSDGVSGNVIEVQKRLCEYEIISRQTAKNIIKRPQLLRAECSKKNAEQEARLLQKTGIKCKLVHVGQKILDQYSNEEIESYLKNLPGGLDSVYIKEDEPGVYALFGSTGKIWVSDEEVDFFFYLSFLRYLALKGKIRT